MEGPCQKPSSACFAECNILAVGFGAVEITASRRSHVRGTTKGMEAGVGTFRRGCEVQHILTAH